MSPSAVPLGTTADHFEDNLNLSIIGFGVDYPPSRTGPGALEVIANRHYPKSTAMEKLFSINRLSGIDFRSTIVTEDYPLMNESEPPTIDQLNTAFLKVGTALSFNACKRAIAESGICVDEITHVVSTTCTNSANPGFDHYVCKELGLRSDVDKTLLHGIGCSGGLAVIRTAANLALGFSYRKKPARVLVLACELTSLFTRSELDSVHKNQDVRVGLCLFADCASACIVSNGIGLTKPTKPIYNLLGWKHDVLVDTEEHLGFTIDPMGWKVILSPRVPSLASASVAPTFNCLIRLLPKLHKDGVPDKANKFDWALHPGGRTIITGVQEAMDLTPDHLRASYEIYRNHGNSSSAAIISVMDNLRRSEGGRENVVACAFGPGIIVEMMIMQRPNLADGTSITNGRLAKSDETAVSGHVASNGHLDDNGHPFAIGHTAEDFPLVGI